ncbi:DUF6397 family protein [Streptomyces sp. NPDC047046]|uniref:DUF6397 family protein n=1 Tax=Streptomyces sp. NPDC047046 TaxID=3155378 RepID=UPI0033C5C35F
MLDVLPSVPGRGTLPRRFTAEEIERRRAAPGFPAALREAVRCVGTADGAELLGIAPHRFTRLAKLGLLAPVDVHLNRYRAVVWAYLAAEVEELGRHRPELLVGRLPAGLRSLAEGDRRAARWRERRRESLHRLSSDPWERAALLAVQLGPEETARAADPDECGYLRRLVPAQGDPALTSLMSALGADELADVQARLAGELARARADRPAPRTGRKVRVGAGAEGVVLKGVSSSPAGRVSTPSAAKNPSAPVPRPAPSPEPTPPPGPAAPPAPSLPRGSAPRATPASPAHPAPRFASPHSVAETLPFPEPVGSPARPSTTPATTSTRPGPSEPSTPQRQEASSSLGVSTAHAPSPATNGTASFPAPSAPTSWGPGAAAPSLAAALSAGPSLPVPSPLLSREHGSAPTAPLASGAHAVSARPEPAVPPSAVARTASPTGQEPSAVPAAPEPGGSPPVAPPVSSSPGGPTLPGTAPAGPPRTPPAAPSCPSPRAASPSGPSSPPVGQQAGAPSAGPIPATYPAAEVAAPSPVASLPAQPPPPLRHRCCPHECASGPVSVPPSCCPSLRADEGADTGARRARRRFVPWPRRGGGTAYRECRRTGGTGQGRCR